MTSCLTRLGVPYINPPMFQPSFLPRGWPDISTVFRKIPYAIEVKIEGKNPTNEQLAMHEKLRYHGWNVQTVRTLDEFLKALRL